MKKTSKKVGEVTFRFYEYPDGTWLAKTCVNKKGLPDIEKSPRSFMKMALMTAQLNQYLQNQMKALDTLLIGKEEIKIMLEQHKAKQEEMDEQVQTKLPFEEADHEKN